jgi:hypothetical protein
MTNRRKEICQTAKQIVISLIHKYASDDEKMLREDDLKDIAQILSTATAGFLCGLDIPIEDKLQSIDGMRDEIMTIVKKYNDRI